MFYFDKLKFVKYDINTMCRKSGAHQIARYTDIYARYMCRRLDNTKTVSSALHLNFISWRHLFSHE
jgi:hypothetical protein